MKCEGVNIIQLDIRHSITVSIAYEPPLHHDLGTESIFVPNAHDGGGPGGRGGNILFDNFLFLVDAGLLSSSAPGVAEGTGCGI